MKLNFLESLSIFMVSVSVFVCGCGEGVRFPVVSAQGKLSFEDGSLLPGGTQVVLNPIEGRVGISTGTIDADGHFELVHASGRSGAEIGTYTVALRPPFEGDGTFEKLVSRDYYVGDGAFAVEVKDDTSPIELKVKKNSAKR